MIRTWQERCQDFDDQRVVSHQDIKNKMQDEIDELRTAYRGLATTVGKLKLKCSNKPKPLTKDEIVEIFIKNNTYWTYDWIKVVRALEKRYGITK